MLTVRNLKVEIAGVEVLRDVGFSLAAGKATVMVGRNGAGKTTTLRAIMGLLPWKAGSVRIDGTELGPLPGHARAGLGIGYAPEDRRLIADFTVEENILVPALVRRMSAAERTHRLDEVYSLLPQLAVMRARPGGGVSGGQGKIVALGRALMLADKVLLLDEPFQGLAPALALEYARTLAHLHSNKRDIAILVTESSPKLLNSIADATLHIERGEIESLASPGDVGGLQHA
ncbi:ATP-binding cassette domain-containing protein [Paracoccus sp. pheM1]|uniref:ATP-binding cassette domain-containing protein n=1 Tax=Paracoccus sp. pheM1 TaxID=2831675 RepID=UPI001BDB7AC0|nr:ATP-binding cassette domain-containing protein [Paracoccus sp. pheM1]MBT0781258.1 ATP-binding cassette domain-containing protein [Paracoccus sp. pheM1]